MYKYPGNYDAVDEMAAQSLVTLTGGLSGKEADTFVSCHLITLPVGSPVIPRTRGYQFCASAPKFGPHAPVSTSRSPHVMKDRPATVHAVALERGVAVQPCALSSVPT